MDTLSNQDVIERLGQILKECKRRSREVEVLINECYGGFSLSEAVEKAYLAETDVEEDEFYPGSSDVAFRTDKRLIDIVRRAGLENSGGRCAELSIETVQVPLGQSIRIREYDGMERVVVHLDKNV